MERTYDADIAGMSHSVGSQMQGVMVSVGGYSDKLVVLLETILKEMKTFAVDPERFTVFKEQVRDYSWSLSLQDTDGVHP